MKPLHLNNTEILEVKVTTKDPEEAVAVANILAKLAQPEIIRVVQAGGGQLIDEAVPNLIPVAPHTRSNSMGFIRCHWSLCKYTNSIYVR